MQNRLKISLFILLGFALFFSSCKSKKICAAYNSYFVFNEANIAPMFSPFGSDSLPLEKQANRFNNFGAISKNGERDDKQLLKYKFKEFKEGEIRPVDSTMLANGDDSTGAIINIKELFPEKVNTDQEAYEHYMRELNADFGKKKKAVSNGKKPSEVEEFDSTTYWNNPPDPQTKEEKKQWKKDKKAYKKGKKARSKARKKEAALKEEEESEEDEEDFDFDLDE